MFILTNRRIKVKINLKLNIMYKVTEKDLTGDIKGFPLEVVQKMIERQVEQGNEANVKVFQGRATSDGKHFKGFDWLKTEEGTIFWLNVVAYKNFNLFFEKYPKQTSNTQKQQTMKQDPTMTLLERDYLIFLTDAKLEVENNPKFSLYKYTRQCRKNANISLILQEMKIVKTIGKGQKIQYYWIGANPTIEMVREILVRQQEMGAKATPKDQVMYFFSYESETENRGKIFKGSENGLVNKENKELELFKRVETFKKEYGREVLITDIKFV